MLSLVVEDEMVGDGRSSLQKWLKERTDHAHSYEPEIAWWDSRFGTVTLRPWNLGADCSRFSCMFNLCGKISHSLDMYISLIE